MIRVQSLLQCAVLTSAVVAVLVLPSRSQAQATNPLIKELDTYLETKQFQGPGFTLKEFLGMLYLIMDNQGKKFPILVDVEAFKEANPEIDESLIYDAKLSFPAFPTEITIDVALRLALAKIPGRNGTYVVLPDRILITTLERTTADYKLSEKVRGTFEKRPLSSVLRELSQKVGTTIVIDNRCGDKAETKISATFINDIPLAGALRIVTEMADLKAVVLDGAILVTTAAHADAIRKEHLQKAKGMEELRLLKEKTNQVSSTGAVGNLGGFGFPGGYVPFPPATMRDPLWPFDTDFIPGRPVPAK